MCRLTASPNKGRSLSSSYLEHGVIGGYRSQLSPDELVRNRYEAKRRTAELQFLNKTREVVNERAVGFYFQSEKRQAVY